MVSPLGKRWSLMFSGAHIIYDHEGFPLPRVASPKLRESYSTNNTEETLFACLITV